MPGPTRTAGPPDHRTTDSNRTCPFSPLPSLNIQSAPAGRHAPAAPADRARGTRGTRAPGMRARSASLGNRQPAIGTWNRRTPRGGVRECGNHSVIGAPEARHAPSSQTGPITGLLDPGVTHSDMPMRRAAHGAAVSEYWNPIRCHPVFGGVSHLPLRCARYTAAWHGGACGALWHRSTASTGAQGRGGLWPGHACFVSEVRTVSDRAEVTQTASLGSRQGGETRAVGAAWGPWLRCRRRVPSSNPRGARLSPMARQKCGSGSSRVHATVFDLLIPASTSDTCKVQPWNQPRRELTLGAELSSGVQCTIA